MCSLACNVFYATQCSTISCSFLFYLLMSIVACISVWLTTCYARVCKEAHTHAHTHTHTHKRTHTHAHTQVCSCNKLLYEPHALYCSNCALKIKRGQTYYTTPPDRVSSAIFCALWLALSAPLLCRCSSPPPLVLLLPFLLCYTPSAVLSAFVCALFLLLLFLPPCYFNRAAPFSLFSLPDQAS